MGPPEAGMAEAAQDFFQRDPLAREEMDKDTHQHEGKVVAGNPTASDDHVDADAVGSLAVKSLEALDLHEEKVLLEDGASVPIACVELQAEGGSVGESGSGSNQLQNLFDSCKGESNPPEVETCLQEVESNQHEMHV